MPTLLTLVLLVLVWIIGQRLEAPVQDLFMKWSAQPATNSRVVLVLIDDESISRLRSRFGPMPWPRSRFIEIFRRVQGNQPALMVFDGHFMNLRTQEDQQVFAAMRALPNLITGLAMEQGQFLNTTMPDYYRLNLGVVNMWQDPDGVTRSLKPFYYNRNNPYQAGVFPALSLAAAYDYLNIRQPANWMLHLESKPGSSGSQLRILSEQVPDGGIKIPLSPDRTFLMRWYRLLPESGTGYRLSHQAIPLWKLYEKNATADLSGKIVLIGASASLYRDYHPSPLTLRHLGTDIHATAIDNILSSQSLQILPAWLSRLITLLAFGLVFLIRFRLRASGLAVLYTLSAMVIYLWLAFMLFSNEGWILSVATPELFMLMAFVVAGALRLSTGERRLAYLEQSLSQLVSPAVYEEIRKARILEAGGTKLEITSLFVDIRDFTTLAETLSPAEVTELLNDFYTAVVAVVFAHRGTVDKFMGDGILIIFGAPIPTERHADEALEAAREILSAIQALSQQWRLEKGIPVEIGISINSGQAFVGFLGPPSRLEYTAVGDTVNLCVRLQEQTKRFHAPIILSEFTAQFLAQHPTDLRELDKVSVKGRESELKIYTLAPAEAGQPPAMPPSGP